MRIFIEVVAVSVLIYFLYTSFPDKVADLVEGALEHGSHILPF
jgi:hypothetical protein